MFVENKKIKTLKIMRIVCLRKKNRVKNFLEM